MCLESMYWLDLKRCYMKQSRLCMGQWVLMPVDDCYVWGRHSYTCVNHSVFTLVVAWSDFWSVECF